MIRRTIKKAFGWLGYSLVKVTPKTVPTGPDYETYRKITGLPGFFSFEAFKLFSWLRDILEKRGGKSSDSNILEIGVYCGMSLLGIGLIFKNKKIVGVDPFYESFDESTFDAEADFLRHKSGNQSGQERYDNLIRKSRELGLAERVQVRKMTQEEYLQNPGPVKNQLIYVDGEHSYDSIKTFLDKIDAVLAPDGFVVFDDFLSAGFPGISEAAHTNPSYQKTLFPVCYAFNKAVFIYKSSDSQMQTIANDIEAAARNNRFKTHRGHNGEIEINQ